MASSATSTAIMLFAAVFCALLVGRVDAGSEGFLGHHTKASLLSTEADFQAAMSSVMGCGGGVNGERLVLLEEALRPMWSVLPKNQHGLVEWGMVRYLAHRYFLQQSSLLVRGFEPMRQINASHMGAADILHKHVPSLVETVLEGKRSSNGFSLEDAVAMVATLEQLISDAEHTLLEVVYKQQRQSSKQSLNHAELSNVMEAYMVHWMMDDDQEAIKILLQNRSLLETAFPKWHEVKNFLNGTVKSLEFKRQHSPKPGHGQVALEGRFSFADAHEAVGSITKKFASFWEGECQVIKESLVALDKTGTGRVSLSEFYGANADGEWRFGESEGYLRELGALDESSPWRGKQVIIPNYLQGASNCIVATPHYLVCCVNECETVLNEIEDAVGAPVAQPEEILPLVGNMTSFDDEPPKIDVALTKQLMRIAETHGGKVPLHGRLFAQWLHYVFPQECPFPHKAGATSAVTPSQFGDNYIATDDEISGHVAARSENTTLLSDAEEAQWMSQWSEEEELRADYSLQLKAPWEGKTNVVLAGGAMFVLILVAAGVVTGNGKTATSTRYDAYEQKAHFV